MDKQLPTKRGRGGYLGALLTSCPLAIIAIDAKGVITFANEETCKLTERPLQELVGKSIVTVYESPEAARETNRRLYECKGKIQDHETRAKTKSGKLVSIRLSAAHLVDSAGNYTGAVGYFEVYRPWTAAEKGSAAYAEKLEAELNEWRALKAPISELYPGLSVLLIRGLLDSCYLERITTDLLNHVKAFRSRVVLVDLSAASIGDGKAVDQLVRTMRTLHILGTKCVLGGIQPEVARAMEALVSDVGSIKSYGSMEDALATALDIIGFRICKRPD